MSVRKEIDKPNEHMIFFHQITLELPLNDITTGAWQEDIGCPIKIILFSSSDVCWIW